MTFADAEPLDPARWFARLQRLEESARDGATPDRLIRITNHLVRLAPLAMRDILPAPLPEDELDAILECGACEHAMLRLMGTRFAFQLEKAPGETEFKATVGLDPGSDFGHAASKNCATAMVTAWVRCLTNLQDGYLGDVTCPDPHKSPSGSPRNSTEH